MLTASCRGGANYWSFDPSKPAGVVAQYHIPTSRAIIDSQMAQMRASGMASIGLPLLLMSGASDGLYIDWSGGWFAPQMAANFEALLATIKSLGFRFVLVAPQFWGAHNFREWTTWNDNLTSEIWNFLANMYGALGACGMDFFLDLCAEGILEETSTGAAMANQMSRLLWTNGTCTWWPDGVPAQDIGISFIPTPANIAMMPKVFCGVNIGGPANWPGRHCPHPYPPEGGWATMHDQLVGVQDCLRSAGAPDRPWILSETYTLVQPEDDAIAADVHRAVVDRGILIDRIFQWPVTPRTALNVSVEVVPTMYQYWFKYGF